MTKSEKEIIILILAILLIFSIGLIHIYGIQELKLIAERLIHLKMF